MPTGEAAPLLRAWRERALLTQEELTERTGLSARSRLAGSKTLILLDDAGSEAQIAPLIPGTPGCMVLVTSRHRLAGLDHTHAVTLDVLPRPTRCSCSPVSSGRSG